MSLPFSEERWNEDLAAERVQLAITKSAGKPKGIYLLDEMGDPITDPLDRLEARAIAYRLLRLSDYLPDPKPLPVLRRAAIVDDEFRDLKN